MRQWYWRLVPIIGLALTGAASAQTGLTLVERNESRAQCAIDDPKISLPACTALIQSGGEPPEYLAIDFAQRGIAYDNMQDFDRAIADYDQAIALDPNNSHTFNNRGVTHLRLKDYDQAIADYGQAIKLDPVNLEAFINRGKVYCVKQDYDLAFADFTHAIQIKPDNIEAFLQRATLYQFEREFDKSIADYDAAIRIEPGEAAYEGRGTSYYLQRDYAHAVTDFTAAIGQPGDTKMAWFRRAMAYMHLDDAGKSQADFAKAEELGVPVTSEASIYVNNLYFDRAIATYDRALQQSASEAAYAGRGDAHFLTGELDGAIADYSRAVDLSASDGWAVEMRGLVYRARGDQKNAKVDLDKAMALFAQTIAGTPKSTAAWNNRCWARAVAGIGLADALSDCNNALKLTPDDAGSLDSRATIYFRMGQYKQALAGFEKSLAMNPSQFSSLFMRGVTTIRLGQKDEGRADVDAAIKLLPVVEKRYALYGIAP